MTLAITYAKLLADLSHELTEIDRNLAREHERQSELLDRRAEVVASLDELRKILEVERTD